MSLQIKQFLNFKYQLLREYNIFLQSFRVQRNKESRKLFLIKHFIHTYLKDQNLLFLYYNYCLEVNFQVLNHFILIIKYFYKNNR